jgi:hypothetical protein
MADEQELSTLNRRVTLVESDVEGERAVSRHILRKVTDNENAILELSKAVSRVEENLALLRADIPRTIATTVAAVMREELAKIRKV